MDPATLIGLGVGLFGGFGKMFGRGRANRELRKLEKSNPAYVQNPEAANRLAMAKTMLNARTPGAMQAERNIYSNAANATSLAQKGSTDASQLLATAGNIQGRTNEAFTQLGMDEAQDYQRRYGNVVGAQEAFINEQDKVFQDKVRRWQDSAQLRGAQTANRANNWGDIANLGFGAFNFGLSGGFNNMFGGGANNPNVANAYAAGVNRPTSFSQLQPPININPNDFYNPAYPWSR